MRLLIKLATAALLVTPPQFTQRNAVGRGHGESCYAAKDLVVQALELLRSDSPAPDLEDANQFLKRASELCAESGDAWYYRSLVEGKLGRRPTSDYALRQAKLFSSEALQSGINPFVLSTPKDSEPPKRPVRTHWALVIGVGDFQGAIPALPYTVSDATAFRDTLIDARYGGFPAENVRLITDHDATLRNIKEALNWLARNAEPDDLAVIYIASHGSARGADTRGANYILTSDTEADTQDHLYATALPMVELTYSVATRLRALRTVVVIDTCFSGAATTGSRKALEELDGGVPDAALSQISQGTGRIILGASQRDQQSWESDRLHHGYFTYFLTQEIRNNPDEPLSRIYANVKRQVSAAVETDHQHLDQQTPVISRSGESVDFSLRESKTGAKSSGSGL